MSVSKVKNIIIAVLLLANLLFLSVVLVNTITEARERRIISQDVTALFNNAGVTVSADSFCNGNGADIISIGRSAYSETIIADRLLGDSNHMNRGSVSTYSNNSGEVVFRSGAEFSAVLKCSDIHADKDIEKSVKKLLEDMKVDAQITGVTDKAGLGKSVSAVCLFIDKEIFNCTLEFNFDSEDNLSDIKGHLLCAVPDTTPQNNNISSASVLMSLFSYISSGEITCSRIEEVSYGYILSMTPLGAGSLSPVWRIRTDIGEFLFNAADNKLIDDFI